MTHCLSAYETVAELRRPAPVTMLVPSYHVRLNECSCFLTRLLVWQLVADSSRSASPRDVDLCHSHGGL